VKSRGKSTRSFPSEWL